MENRAFALATGAFIIVLVVAAALAGNWLAGAPLERAPYRVVSLQPVSGLNPQGQVRFRGIGAGRVARIELDPANSQRILIDIEVDKRIPITRGTYAQLGQEGITGIAYVHLLDDGKQPAAAQPAADGLVEIPLRPSFLDDIFDSAGGITKDVREVLANVNALLTESNRKDVTALLGSLRRVSADLEAVAHRLPAVMARAEGFVSEENRRATTETLANLNAAAKEWPALSRDARALATELPALARDMKLLVDEARQFAASANRLAEDARGTSGSMREDTLPRVNALAESVERGAERLGRLATELERQPDSVLWGRPAPRPGPGERGFQ